MASLLKERFTGKTIQNVKKGLNERFSNQPKLIFDGKVYA